MGSYYHLDRVIAGVEMLQYLRHDLPLRTGVFLTHGSVHQFRYILVEVRDEVLEVLLVGLRIQTFTPNPLHSVPAASCEEEKTIILSSLPSVLEFKFMHFTHFSIILSLYLLRLVPKGNRNVSYKRQWKICFSQYCSVIRHL